MRLILDTFLALIEKKSSCKSYLAVVIGKLGWKSSSLS